ncbi:MAG: VOC family protein [Thermoleophilaceae bacterium]
MSLPPDTSIGTVRLVVADLDALAGFYQEAIGLREVEQSGDTVRLGVEPGAPLVELVGRPDAAPSPPRSTGLFHLAVLVPSRLELARALRRVAAAGWRFTGASDHLVSEALYLDDPEGNGIEIYHDRPREEWTYDNGELQMATIPLDLEGVVGELPDDDESDAGMPPGTRMGHVHLKVSELPPAEEFYEHGLGFDVVVRSYPGALFVSAGGYHHHVGMNTWTSGGGSAPPAGSRGLDWYQVLLPSPEALAQESDRLEAEGARIEQYDGGVLATDPSGNRVLLSSLS